MKTYKRLRKLQWEIVGPDPRIFSVSCSRSQRGLSLSLVMWC